MTFFIITLIGYILLFLSIIVNIILLVGARNLLKKFEIYEEWIFYFRGEINRVTIRLKNADVAYSPDGNSYRVFEKDDDVGFIFSELERIMTEFNERIK